MRRASSIALVSFSISFALLLVGCGPADAADKAQARTFTGEYQWDNGGRGPLEAEFRPTGEETWKLVFRFRFDGKRYTWKGTARGSLEDGSEITGTARGGGGRTWEFEGTVDGGVIVASHAEKRGDRLQESGTFRLSP